MSNIPSFSDLETDDFSLAVLSSFSERNRFTLDNESGDKTLVKPLPYLDDSLSETTSKHQVKNELRNPESGDIYIDADVDKTTESFKRQVDVDKAGEMVAMARKEVHLDFDGGHAAGTTPPLEAHAADNGGNEEDRMLPLLDEFTALTVSYSDDTGSNVNSETDCWDDLEIADEDGDTLLHQAIILNNNELASLLIRVMSQSGIDLNSRNLLFQTALHLAVLTEQTDIIEELVENGAEITVRDKNGRTPLHIACEMQRPAFLRVLLTNEVRDACVRSGPKMKPISVLDIKNYEGEACVHIAAKRGDVHLMQCIIKHGANGNLADEKSGRTALHFAAESNDIKMVSFLLGVNGINASPETLSEETPILLAYLRDFDEVVELFQQKRNP